MATRRSAQGVYIASLKFNANVAATLDDASATYSASQFLALLRPEHAELLRRASVKTAETVSSPLRFIAGNLMVHLRAARKCAAGYFCQRPRHVRSATVPANRSSARFLSTPLTKEVGAIGGVMQRSFERLKKRGFALGQVERRRNQNMQERARHFLPLPTGEGVRLQRAGWSNHGEVPERVKTISNRLRSVSGEY